VTEKPGKEHLYIGRFQMQGRHACPASSPPGGGKIFENNKQ